MPDVRLGKQKVKYDKRTLVFQRYASALPVPPAAVDPPTPPSSWGMLLNDKIGDCTCAAQAHQAQSWKAQLGVDVHFTDKQVLNAYEKLTGYDPKQTDANGNNPTDTGATMLDAVNQWRSRGIGGHKAYAYAALDPHDVVQAQQCTWGFGDMYLGLDLPVTAQSQVDANQVWDVVTGGGQAAAPGSWGGHCVCVVGYDQIGPKFVSWGQIYQMSWRFYTAYCDESYAVISHDELDKHRRTVHDFNWSTLESDLASIPKAA